MDMKKEAPYGNTTERAADEAALRETEPTQAVRAAEGGEGSQTPVTGTGSEEGAAGILTGPISFSKECAEGHSIGEAIRLLEDSDNIPFLSEADFAKVLGIYRKIPQRGFLYGQWLSETEAESYKSTPGQPGSPEAPAE